MVSKKATHAVKTPVRKAPEKEHNYYIVTSDVPVPADQDRRRGRWSFLAKMKLRSSFTFPQEDYNKTHAALHYAKKHYGVEFATFKEGDGYRAFRVK